MGRRLSHDAGQFTNMEAMETQRNPGREGGTKKKSNKSKREKKVLREQTLSALGTTISI